MKVLQQKTRMRKKTELDPSAAEFRPKPTSVEIPKWRLRDIAIEDDDGDI